MSKIDRFVAKIFLPLLAVAVLLAGVAMVLVITGWQPPWIKP